jgi:anhydro-N-acetylmuramic acid kinase
MDTSHHQPKTSFTIIGLMSGTSLDGVDIAHCTFDALPDSYRYTLNVCETIPYSKEWTDLLKSLPFLSAQEYAATHVHYGHYLGKLVRQFTLKFKLSADFVASHGHTIFHQPGKMFTSQVGDGAALAAECGIPVICDFRSLDVAHGGQGAPLVPIGDELLFPEFSYCLNLGGFANISFNNNGKRQAFDICPANFILNHLAILAGEPFDKDGKLAASGNINTYLLDSLDALPYYSAAKPKSLGREWVEKEFLPLFNQSDCSINDQLRTAVEHIVNQVNKCIHPAGKSTLLITGGGALNRFLIERLNKIISIELILPDRSIIEYKEALLFAFLGLLRVLNKPNCLSSVTGAMKDVCGGAIYLP